MDIQRDKLIRMSEKKLVKLAQAGDSTAFTILWDKYKGRLFSSVYSIVVNKIDAEDVLQEASMKVYSSINRFKGESTFFTWAYRVTRHVAIDWRRKYNKPTNESIEFNEEYVVGESSRSSYCVAEEVGNRQSVSRLKKAIGDLSIEHREVILLREVHGLSYDEISDSLGISKGTVMSRLFYARKKLQSQVEQVL